MPILAVFGLLACAPSPEPAAPEAVPEPAPEAKAQVERLPVIDMHMHAHEVPLPIPEGAPGPCLPAPCEPRGSATGTAEATLERTLAAMDEHHVVKAFLSTADLAILKSWVQSAPDLFIPSPFIVQPGDLPVQALREMYEAGELKGMGEIGSQLVGIPPNDPSLEPYFALAEEFDVPVLIHMEGIGPPVPGFRVAAGRPLLIEDVLVAHPKLRVSVENCGYPFGDEMIAMMTQYPQLHCDVSTMTWVLPREVFHHYLQELMQAGLGKRLMYGSDQMRWPEMIGESIDAVGSAGFLTDEQKRDILYHNAVRFLRMEEEQTP